MSEEKKDLELEEEANASGGPEEGREKKEPVTLEGTLYTWTQALVIAVVGVVMLFTFGVRLISVNGPSMQDTLYTGDQLLVLNAMFCDFKAGDVVVINDYNAEPQLNETLVKRIVAVGGQTVDIDFSSGTVYVDGRELDEPYIKEPTYTPEGTEFPLTLAEDEVFVMGDNRNHSSDSRDARLGPVKTGYLQGKALLLLTPGATPDTERRDWGRIGLVR
ncbi:MAG: signal peptidase I [Oscillospiraceae bacterium]|nr:signal peptidase I [Oscillospiraceae bacterium]